MISSRWTVSSLVIALVLAVFGGMTLGEGVWKSDDDELHVIHEDRHLFIPGDGDEFDLSDLADGETREFGAGDRQFTATREGDEVMLKGTRREDGESFDLVCRVDRDTCKVVTFGEDSGKVMIVVKKSHECEDGEGDCREISLMMGVGDAVAGARSHVVLDTFVDCDEGEDCASVIKRIHVGEGDHAGAVFLEKLGDEHGNLLVVGGEHGHANLLVVGEGDQVVLRCPEGDTTMRVARDEAEDGFLCPKHSVPLEKMPAPARIHRIKVDSPGTGGQEM